MAWEATVKRVGWAKRLESVIAIAVKMTRESVSVGHTSLVLPNGLFGFVA